MFFQESPKLNHPFQEDVVLQNFLKRRIPSTFLGEIEKDLIRFSDRILTEAEELCRISESNEPQLRQYDPWGRRIDEVIVSAGWKGLERISAEEGLVAIGYERKHGEYSRIHQFAKLFLFHPSSDFYTCPLAMTDGAARLIEVHGNPKMKEHAYRRLTSRDPKLFWTSGQWMTERTGGSDVSASETLARKEGAHYRLYGDKWFTSAVTSQMAMTLSQIEGERGLGLFYLETRDGLGNLNHIRVNRLKNKLGTRSLPTAEITLDGTIAELVGSPGEGVKRMSTLFNITRIYTACCAAATMRRAVSLAQDYSKRRRAFGKTLEQHPAHQRTLCKLRATTDGAFYFLFHLIHLLGRDECGVASPEEKSLLRALTPLAKLMISKDGVSVVSEVLECFGGAGYVEDTGLPRMLRDVQVLAIWEGTTNVLSLDFLRAIEKEKVFEPLLNYLESNIQDAPLRQRLDAYKRFAEKLLRSPQMEKELHAREFAMLTAAIMTTLQVDATLAATRDHWLREIDRLQCYIKEI